MPHAAFTESRLSNLRPKAGEATTRYWDKTTTGLCALVGTKAVTFYAKAGGKMHKIGRHPDWTLLEARERCKEIRRLVGEGKDPSPEPTAALMSMRAAFDMFEATRLAKRRDATGKEYRRQFEQFIFPKWGDTPIDRLTRREVVELHGEITKAGTPTRANRVIATVSSLYGWLYAADIYKGENPAAKVERNHEEPRQTYLTPQQVGELHAALDAYAGHVKGNDVAADCIRLIIATGCRRGEAMRATWDQFNADLTIWTKPASTTKQKKLHRVPLGPAAQVILARRRAASKKGVAYVFPGKYGANHIRQLRSCWEAVQAATGLAGVRVHDCRHTYASLAISAGVPLQVVGGLLGHSAPRTTAKYAHLYDDDLRSAVGRVSALVTGDNGGGE